MRRDIEFCGHGGVVLRGWWYAPVARAPTIVMAHGFSATKEMALDAYAARFAHVGCGVLVYDHRHLGASDGEPRQLINPWAQARDYRYAIDWVLAQREVTDRRVVAWGSSFSGGQVLVIGALDERITAVIASVPFAGVAGSDYADSAARFTALRAAFESRADDTTAMGPLKVVDDPDDADGLRVFLPQAESTEWFLAAGRKPPARWRNRVWLAGMVGSDPPFDPGVAVPHLHKPLLMVVATDDRLAATDVALDAFARASEPKQLVTIEGHHFAPYSGAAFETASNAMCEFVRAL